MKIIDILDLPTVAGVSMFSSRFSVTYRSGNVMRHTTSLNDPAHRMARTDLKYAEFVDVLGNVTDEFWGNRSDFNLSFLAKCARGEQFFVIVYPHEAGEAKAYRAVGVRGWLGSEYEYHDWSQQHFVQARDMTWEMEQKSA